jgi:hypothetical protein
VLAGALLLGGLLAFLLDPGPSKIESPAPMRA